MAGEYAGRLPVYRPDAGRDLPLANILGSANLPTGLISRDAREIERLDGLIREGGLRAAFDRATGGSSDALTL